MNWNKLLALAVPLLVIGACGDNHSRGADASQEVVTYTEHIRPLIAENCAACHTPGGIGPFALGSYEEAKVRAVSMASATESRQMPPYYANNSGECNDYEGASWLQDHDIALFEQWVADGTLEGDTSIPVPEERPLPTLSGNVVSAPMAQAYTPDQSLTDDYRCFVVESPGEMVVSGFNLVPGNPRIVHHVIAYQTVSKGGANQALAKDLAAPGPGYPCLQSEGPGVDAVSFAGWAPGAGAVLFPHDAAVSLPGSLPLILEVHYNVVGGPGESDLSTLELQTTTEPHKELTGIDLYNFEFYAPPGESSFTTVQDYKISTYAPHITRPMRVLGVSPHMHQLGKSARIERVLANGDVECIMDTPRWDFNWQLTYWFANEVILLPGDTLRLSCEFDTSDRTTGVTWGEGTLDEMCIGYLQGIMLDD